MPGCDTHRVVQKHPHLTIQRAAFRADGGSMNFSAAGLQTKHLPAVCGPFYEQLGHYFTSRSTSAIAKYILRRVFIK